jgi:hypothetical protein
MCLARQLDPNERPFSMLTHSSGTATTGPSVLAADFAGYSRLMGADDRARTRH